MIIKNCPSCQDYDVFGLPNEGCCYHYNDYCKYHDDCIIKQIVNECNWEIQAEPDYNNRGDLAERILSMLETKN